jgi:RNA polymerase II C-terminal domain phosphatase-like 3/4
MVMNAFSYYSFLMFWVYMAFYICCLSEHVYDETIDISKGSLFMLEHMQVMTKLRPFVRTFLKEASEMFEMYIYTMGDRQYSLEMARLLDPRGEYFKDKVISRDDGTQKNVKDLDLVLGAENSILILDDKEEVSALLVSDLFLLNCLIGCVEI